MKTKPYKALTLIRMILNEPIKLRREASATELAIVRLAARGYSIVEIASELKISATNVSYYLREINRRYGLSKSGITKRAFERIESVLELVEK